MRHNYNPWPLGNLPEDWRRQEPEMIRGLGYEWSDPREINEIFEEELAAYSGSKHAVLTDSCTNALFLCLKLREVSGLVSIPSQTYVSVASQIIHAGARPEFTETEWSGVYQLGSTGIFDSAARFTKGMYLGEGTLQCLSFQIKKILPIGRGGAILTDSAEEADWLRKAVYDGRDLKTPYDSEYHVGSLGWHCYMTPEDAARGLILMSKVGEENADSMNQNNYPDIRAWEPFASIDKENRLNKKSGAF